MIYIFTKESSAFNKSNYHEEPSDMNPGQLGQKRNAQWYAT